MDHIKVVSYWKYCGDAKGGKIWYHIKDIAHRKKLELYDKKS